MSETIIRINEREWNLFIWQRDECERVQGKACEGCGLMKDCISLYQKVGELYKSNIATCREHENQQPSKGNPQVENHGEDIEPVFKRVHRNLRVVRKNGKVVA